MVVCMFCREYNNANGFCYQIYHAAVTWDKAQETCNEEMVNLSNEEELTFLKTTILEPQAERSVIWLAGKKDQFGSYK